MTHLMFLVSGSENALVPEVGVLDENYQGVGDQYTVECLGSWTGRCNR